MGNGCFSAKRRRKLAAVPQMSEQAESPLDKSEQKKTLITSEAHDISLSEQSTHGHSTIKWKRGDLIGEGAYAKVFQ
jgi:hypothetical protein